MRWRLLVVAATTALLAAAPGAAAPRACPGPGCALVGSIPVVFPASGKATFYVVTFKGKATKPPVIALALSGPSATGHEAIAAVESKAQLAGGTATVTILLGVSNIKRAVAAVGVARGSTSLEGFAPNGTFTPLGNPTVTPTACKLFDGKYTALENLGFSWQQFWLGKSPKSQDVAQGILANQIKASCR